MGTLTEAFARFTGGLNPLLVIGFAAVLAFGSLSWLGRHGFDVRGSGHRRGWITASVLAAGLAVAMVVVDALSPLAADINVPFPASLAFYPAIAFVAETAFHLLPLAVLVAVIRPPAGATGNASFWAIILLAALIEPTFQVVLAGAEEYPLWQHAYVAVHIFVFNVLQLWTYRRYDFVTMYLFRLVYYLIWHIVWGHLRLGLLF